MASILKEITKYLPEGKVADAAFEGANIVFYTKDKDYFLDNLGTIRNAVREFKKRIELRMEPAICLEPKEAEKIIRVILPPESGIQEIVFDPPRSEVIINAEKPGLVIGKQGELLREIRAKTFWVPLIERVPPLRSKLVETIRAVLYEHAEEEGS